ncbi:MAG TPA: hypothetical protein VKR26_20795 [Terriglobales bacterium]|jgi:hypothetical protein|nr:hypothetical protein [Terriglobales bacterium]
MANEIPDISPDMQRLYKRFERWRSAHTGRLPIPERLWTAAAELAREHGVFPTAKALHLEYGKLKDRAEALGQEKKVVRKMRSAIPRHAVSTAAPTFMELITPRSGSAASAVVELEGPRGRMKIELKGITTAELVALSRALWDGEA